MIGGTSRVIRPAVKISQIDAIAEDRSAEQDADDVLGQHQVDRHGRTGPSRSAKIAVPSVALPFLKRQRRRADRAETTK
jgi:hypothetical protein